MSWVRWLLFLLLALPLTASAQTNPNFVSGQTLTAQQLNNAFSQKTDFPTPAIPLGSGVSGVLPVGNGGSGASIFTVGKPLLGNGTNPFGTAATTGNTTTIVTGTGTAPTSGDCSQWDANGNAGDSGAPCGKVLSFGPVGTPRTGVVTTQTGDYTFAQISGVASFGQLPVVTADSVVGNPTSASASPTNVPLINCSGGATALNYSTSTHTFSCNTISGGSATSITIGSTAIGAGSPNFILTAGAAGNLLGQIAQVTFAMLPNTAADNLIGNASASTAAPNNVPLVNCAGGTNALNYSTSTHTFTCNTIAAGTGTVTSVSDGGFTPLFTASVATPTTTPAITYTAINQAANLIYAGPTTGAAAAPTFRAAVAADIPSLPSTQITGLGTSATVNTGTSGATIPLNNGGFTQSGVANFTNTFQINGNAMTFPAAAATLPQTVAAGTATLGTAAIASGACATVVTGTATSGSAGNILTTDILLASYGSDPTGVTGYGVSATAAVLTVYPYPTAGAANFKVCNSTPASITPSALTLNWRVTR